MEFNYWFETEEMKKKKTKEIGIEEKGGEEEDVKRGRIKEKRDKRERI